MAARAETRDSESEARGRGVALNFEESGAETAPSSSSSLSSPMKLPRRLRRRLMAPKSPITAQDIEAKLQQAHLRRQKFYELLMSKARPKPRGSLRSPSEEEELSRRLEERLNAAEQKRLSILERAQMRLARLDALRQAAKTGLETRFEKERDELSAKVQSRAKQAEENRTRLLKACSLRRAARRDRATQSLLQRSIKERKYKDCIAASICQKRAAAQRKRSRMLEEEKAKACAMISRVRRDVRSVHSKQEKESPGYLKQRITSQHSPLMNQEQESVSKIVSYWRRFVHLRKTTFALATAFKALGICGESVKSMSFEQLALKMDSPATIRTTKDLVNRLESWYLNSLAATGNFSRLENIDHLLIRVASKIKKGNSNTNTKKKVVSKESPSSKKAPLHPAVFSRYPVKILLCTYMILGHPDAIFNRRTDCENALSLSATDFVREFELLLKVIIQGPIQTAQKETALGPSKITFRSQLETFDKAWCSYLLHFVAWKDNDAKLLEDDLVRAACNLELSMLQTSIMTTEGENADPTYGVNAFHKQVLESQKLLRDKLQQLSGNPGLERLETALSEIRSQFTMSKDSARSLPSSAAANSSPCQPASFDHSLVSASSETSDGTNTYQNVRKQIQASVEKDQSHLAEHAGSSSAFETVASGHLNSAAFVISENELLVNEILHEHHRDFADTLNLGDEDQNSLKAKVRETMEKAFWDGVMESMKENNSDFGWILKLVREVRDELSDISPQVWKQEITDRIDIDILSQLLRSGNLDMEYFGKILEYALVTLRKLSSPASDNDLVSIHYKFLKELAETLQAEDDSKASRALAITKGLRFVLQQIQNLKREISKARLRMVEPLIRSTAGLEYLRNAFSNRHGSPTHAQISLPITRRWLASTRMVVDQEWHEYIDSLSLSDVTSNELSSGLPPTTLRTGGSISVGSKKISSTDTIDLSLPGERLLECKGERIDLLVRLGLVKLVIEVAGLSLEVLPETLKLNLARLRAVQSQLQKIIVIATCLLIVRQILLSENLVTSPQGVEKITSKCAKKLCEVLETVEDAGIPDIVETIMGCEEDNDNLPFTGKLREKKQILASMLGKSLQASDAVFERVSRAVYVAARGVVLGGSGAKGRELAEASLRRVGAALLTDSLVKAVEVLVVVAVVTCNVHKPWYEELIKNI